MKKINSNNKNKIVILRVKKSQFSPLFNPLGKRLCDVIVTRDVRKRSAFSALASAKYGSLGSIFILVWRCFITHE